MFDHSKKAERLKQPKPQNAIQRTDGTSYIKIEDLPKRKFFRAVNGATVYTHSGYNRYSKKYLGESWKNGNDRYFKKGTIVEFEFEY